jgi:translation initiation factor IF-2
MEQAPPPPQPVKAAATPVAKPAATKPVATPVKAATPKPVAPKPAAPKPAAAAASNEIVIDYADPKPCAGRLEPAKRNGKDVLICKPD